MVIVDGEKPAILLGSDDETNQLALFDKVDQDNLAAAIISGKELGGNAIAVYTSKGSAILSGHRNIIPIIKVSDKRDNIIWISD